jgi:hypothetical protein
MVGAGEDDPLNQTPSCAFISRMKPIALTVALLCGCGVESVPVSSDTAEVTIDAGCVPTDYYHPPADCARPTYCDDGNQCAPHLAFRCAGSGVCVGSSSRCAELDAGTAVTCR